MVTLFAPPCTGPPQHISYAHPMAQAFDLCSEPSMTLSHLSLVAAPEDAWVWPSPVAECSVGNSELYSSCYPHSSPNDRVSATSSPDAAYAQGSISKDLDYFSQSKQDTRSGKHDKVMPSIRSKLRHYSTSSTRPHKCGHCPRTFARRHDLERHTRVHTGAKPYICPCCYKTFPRSDARGRHFRNEAACGHGPQVLAFIKKIPIAPSSHHSYTYTISGQY